MNRTSEEVEMAATQPTRNHSFHLGRTLAMLGIALALVMGVFAARAAASLEYWSSDGREPPSQCLLKTTHQLEAATDSKGLHAGHSTIGRQGLYASIRQASSGLLKRRNHFLAGFVFEVMPQQGWQSRRVVVVAIAFAVIGASALFIVLGIRNQEAADAATLPPIMATADAPYASAEPQFHIPAGVTASDDARSKIVLTQPEVHWVFADGPNLPPLVSPCGGYLASDSARVGAHQLALVSPTVWKLSRTVVYRDVNTARQAMAERRGAVQQCAHHDDGNGVATVWSWQPLQIGDEAMAVGSQRYRGSNVLPGHQRGVVMRQGRTLVMFVDFGQSRTPPTLSEISGYATVAKPFATTLASAPWNQ